MDSTGNTAWAPRSEACPETPPPTLVHQPAGRWIFFHWRLEPLCLSQLTHQAEEPETREGDALLTLISRLPLQLLPVGQISLSFLGGKAILLKGEPTEVKEGSGIWVGSQGVYPGPRHGFLTLSDPHSNPEREHVCTIVSLMVRRSFLLPVSSARLTSTGHLIHMAENE